MVKRKIEKRFVKEACLSTAYGRDLTLESWDAIAHTEADENCRVVAIKLGQGVMCVTYELKDGRKWPQLKCNVRNIDPVLFKKDPPLREWATAKLLEHEYKRCTIESRVFAAKHAISDQTHSEDRRLEKEIAKEKQLHDERCTAAWEDYVGVADSLAIISREHEALASKVESVISKVVAGRKRCDKLEQELDNETTRRASKLSAMDDALKRTNETSEALSEQNRELKEEVRRLKAAIKEAKKNESEQ